MEILLGVTADFGNLRTAPLAGAALWQVAAPETMEPPFHSTGADDPFETFAQQRSER